MFQILDNSHNYIFNILLEFFKLHFLSLVICLYMVIQFHVFQSNTSNLSTAIGFQVFISHTNNHGFKSLFLFDMAQSAWAVEDTDCISEEE